MIEIKKLVKLGAISIICLIVFGYLHTSEEFYTITKKTLFKGVKAVWFDAFYALFKYAILLVGLSLPLVTVITLILKKGQH